MHPGLYTRLPLGPAPDWAGGKVQPSSHKADPACEEPPPPTGGLRAALTLELGSEESIVAIDLLSAYTAMHITVLFLLGKVRYFSLSMTFF